MKHCSSYVGTIDNDSEVLASIRTALKGSGFRASFRGRGPYTAQSDFPLWLNPPKVAVYLRHVGKSWSPGCNARMPDVKESLISKFLIIFGLVKPVAPVASTPAPVKKPVVDAPAAEIHIFEVTLSQMVANTISSMSDMCSDFGSDLNDLDSAKTNWAIAKGVVDDLLTAEHVNIVSHFKNGFTMMMLPNDTMEKMESLSSKFYIEITVPGTKTPIVVHSDDVSW